MLILNGWKEVLSIFAVTISVGLLIGMLLLINSTKKIDKSQQEIRQEKVTQAQEQQSSESRSKASSTTVEVPEYEMPDDTDIPETTETARAKDRYQGSRGHEQGHYMSQGSIIPEPSGNIPWVVYHTIDRGHNVSTFIDSHFGFRYFELAGGNVIIESPYTTAEGRQWIKDQVKEGKILEMKDKFSDEIYWQENID